MRLIMSKKEKQITRLLSKPKDFTFEELSSLLNALGYIKDNKGKTSGSRVAFYNPATSGIIRLDKPHPCNELKAYLIKYVIIKLKENGDI
jgi:hypothetical protein